MRNYARFIRMVIQWSILWSSSAHMPATLGPELNPESTLANEPAPVHNPIALPKKILRGLLVTAMVVVPYSYAPVFCNTATEADPELPALPDTATEAVPEASALPDMAMEAVPKTRVPALQAPPRVPELSAPPWSPELPAPP
ncbi:hypothetical protein DPX16_13571 [Anabarilius grahami]|uniref:Uncharacterized protein n=1 Tax=Anabarilius grahami TaxID=495550 RepID=A0A3N0YCS7_ANAGA|nr:hypothetical protein DPX16_13571 [Anabarilius grahami]